MNYLSESNDSFSLLGFHFGIVFLFVCFDPHLTLKCSLTAYGWLFLVGKTEHVDKACPL